ncbi:MAG: glycoside hydrolase family 38 C-terminal domain-containing protein [Christensenellales bacterium]
MPTKVLHMIGNSHIDPVWFWQREEGLQAILATFSSALDRMEEDPDFRFTATSAAFYAYVEKAAPWMIPKIAARVAEGRWELAGGWWLEPDCNLPCGEAFVRQGLYGQLFFLSRFGRMAAIGANFDSFGHNPMLPQLLAGCRLSGYVFLRPQFRTSQQGKLKGLAPLFRWVSPDGTAIPALSLPGEYTTWFFEPTRKNIEDTLGEMGSLPALACCFGVGNHGGGPTRDNIRAVRTLQEAYPGVALRFSTLAAFFSSVKDQQLPAIDVMLEHINEGCYSVDHHYKQAVRGAEAALLRAEKYGAMARLMGAPWGAGDLAGLWQRLLFCQFHDTLGGTVIEEARDDALRDVGGVHAQADALAFDAMQALIARLDLSGEGTPLILFNLEGKSRCAVAEAELEFFCKDELDIRDDQGISVPYQRIKTAATTAWHHLGGRRRVLFQAEVPALGWRVWRLHHRGGNLLETAYAGDDRVLENEAVRLELNQQGDPVSLMEKAGGYEALSGPLRLAIWLDEGDSWGHRGPDRRLEKLDEAFRTEEVKCILRGGLRSVIRVRQSAPGLHVETLYTLQAGESSVRVDLSLTWDRPLHQLRLEIPCDNVRTAAEGPYCTLQREQDSSGALYMHRWLDIRGEGGAGLSVHNDGVYAFHAQPGRTDIILLRSAMFAQGANPGWYREEDVHRHMDLGEHHYRFLLSPHGRPLPSHALIAGAAGGFDYLAASPRAGGSGAPCQGLFAADAPPIALGALKKAEDNDDLILRLYETGGQSGAARIRLGDIADDIAFRPFQILTLRLQGGRFIPTNLLEMPGTEPYQDPQGRNP